MKQTNILFISLLGVIMVFGTCKSDEDTNPKQCNELIEGTITINNESFTLDLEVKGSGTYSISRIEYLDETGSARSVSDPSLPWELTITYTGQNGTQYPYRLAITSTVTNGSINSSVKGSDGTTSIDDERFCSQSI
jgi:hypothetical protein